MALSIPDNARGPILDVDLSARAEPATILVRNVTTGKTLALKVPEAWGGLDLTLNFFRRTIRDSGLGDRSGLLDPTNNGLWVPEPLITGLNDIEIEFISVESDTHFVATPTTPRGVAIDGTYIYWADSGGGGNIGRAKLDGTSPNGAFVETPTTPLDIAVNASFLYWADSGSGNIGRAKLDGTSPNGAFVETPVVPTGVAVDGTYIYWADSSAKTIGRCKLDASSPNNELIKGFQLPTGVAVDGTYIYIADETASTIYRAKLDGSGLVDLLTKVGSVSSVAVDATYIYWASTGGSIGRARLDGSEVIYPYVVAPNLPRGVDASANYLYWADFSIGDIGRAKLKGEPKVSATLRWDKAYF